jgi:cold-inducible RNA-binding protein
LIKMASRRKDKKDDDSPPRRLDSAKLYIGNLSERVTDSELQNAFSKYGKVRDCRIIVESGSGRSKGFAFITFENPEDGQTAQQETHDKLELDGKRLIVEIARGGEKHNRRNEPYEKRNFRKDSERDRKDSDQKYVEHDRERRDRPRFPDLPPWPRDYPWYGRDPRELPAPFDRGDPFRRDDRGDPYRFPYPPIPYGLPPVVPEEYFGYYERRERDNYRHDWDSRDRRRDRDWDSRDRRDFISDKSFDRSSSPSRSSSNRDRDYRKDDRYERDSKDSHSGHGRENSQDRSRRT